jgi:ubiquinone/menaquinone biosynthesis C-methylase UbiE
LKHIVSTWALCSIANLEQALDEIYRVMQPGGALHLVEHVLHSDNRNVQRLQQALTPIQKHIADGCHLNRNIERALKDTGLELAECRYFDAEGIPKIAQRMLLARAVRP